MTWNDSNRLLCRGAGLWVVGGQGAGHGCFRPGPDGRTVVQLGDRVVHLDRPRARRQRERLRLPERPINKLDLDGRIAWRKWVKRGVLASGVAAAVGCIVATAGACGVATAVAVSASAASNAWGAYKKETTWGRAIQNTAVDIGFSRFKAVRSVGKLPIGKRVKMSYTTASRNTASNSRRHAAPAIKSRNTSYRQAARYRPVNTGFNTGVHIASGYHSSRGWR